MINQTLNSVQQEHEAKIVGDVMINSLNKEDKNVIFFFNVPTLREERIAEVEKEILLAKEEQEKQKRDKQREKERTAELKAKFFLLNEEEEKQKKEEKRQKKLLNKRVKKDLKRLVKLAKKYNIPIKK